MKRTLILIGAMLAFYAWAIVPALSFVARMKGMH